MIRFQIYGEVIEVANAASAYALRLALEKAQADERAACANVATEYAQSKTAFADAIERGEAPGDEEDRKDADSAAYGARTVAYLILKRGSATKTQG